jgi:tripartite-type tricarboxylate transporter receptor subunit TctC
MKARIRKSCAATLAAATLSAVVICDPAPVLAQNFPTRPITIVDPYAAGGASDLALRLIAQRVSEQIGQQIIIENRPGAGGAVGAGVVKQARPDGYTLLQTNQGMFSIAPHIIKNLSYDPLNEFTPIVQLWETYSVLIVPANLPASSPAELAALAKRKQGGLNNATQGIGTMGHINGVLSAKAFGTPLTHIHYPGGAAAKPDVLSGRIDMTFVIYGLYRSEIEQGKVKVLAVPAKSRVSLWPNIPTMAEAGFPGVDHVQWFGLFGPAKMDPAIVKALNAAFAKALMSPDLVEKLGATNGFVVKPNAPDAFAAHVKATYAEMGKLVEEAGIPKQ